jgi:hypothetical protein
MRAREIVREGIFDSFKSKAATRFGQTTQRQKDAAAWKAQVQSKNKPAPASPAAPQPLTHGTTRKASDGQTYKLDIGRGGDMIWFNVVTGAEADPAIDVELMK